MKEEIESIKNYALENNVPIMQDDGINYLTNYIKKNKIKKKTRDLFVLGIEKSGILIVL